MYKLENYGCKMETILPEFFYVSCNNDLNQESWFDAEYIYIEGIDLHFREYKRNIEVRNACVLLLLHLQSYTKALNFVLFYGEKQEV